MHAVRHTDDASTWTPAPDYASGDSGIGGGAAEQGEFGDEEEDFVAEVSALLIRGEIRSMFQFL